MSKHTYVHKETDRAKDKQAFKRQRRGFNKQTIMSKYVQKATERPKFCYKLTTLVLYFKAFKTAG